MPSFFIICHQYYPHATPNPAPLPVALGYSKAILSTLIEGGNYGQFFPEASVVPIPNYPLPPSQNYMDTRLHPIPKTCPNPSEMAKFAKHGKMSKSQFFLVFSCRTKFSDFFYVETIGKTACFTMSRNRDKCVNYDHNESNNCCNNKCYNYYFHYDHN